jgi:hypothetical protein
VFLGDHLTAEVVAILIATTGVVITTLRRAAQKNSPT